MSETETEIVWGLELNELSARKALARQMGGVERVERQRRAGRLTVRERIDRLLDPGTFQEIGSIAGAAAYGENGEIEEFLPANCVFGRGLLDGRTVVVEGDDFTVRGGSADAAIWTKMLTAENMAAAYRIPIVRLLEGSGGGGSVKTIEKTGRANLPNGVGTPAGLHLCAANMAVVPVVALGLGAVAGLGAARLALSHYSVVVKSLTSVFVAGPPVVAALGEERTREELGGWKVQTSSGSVDHAVDTEEEAFECARQFLSYLPNSVHELAPRVRNWDPVDRRDEIPASIVPRESSFFEMGREYGRSLITGLARLDGWPVALMAGDPLHGGGAWSTATCQKIIRCLDLAETFHLPVVHLVDCPGFQVGLAAEQSGLVRQGVRVIAALNQTTVPWCSIIIRNAYGVGGGAHQPHSRQCFRYAWPSASWGSLPLSGGVEAAYRAELDAAADPEAKLAEIEARLNRLRSPFRTAEAFWVRRSSTPATRGGFYANLPISPRHAAPQAERDRFPFNPDTIRMLADILREKGLSEIELASRDNRIRIAQAFRDGEGPATRIAVGDPGSRQRPAANGHTSPPASVGESVPQAQHPGAVLSPMVGIAYLSPKPDAPPFVTIGQRVEAGETLLLIEAMKTFTSIAAPVGGTVARMLVTNGQTVEFGETLVVIE